MSKLHELLAAEPDVKSASEAILRETKDTFNKRHDHFIGTLKSYQPLEEGGETIPDDAKEMVTTVKDKLDHTQKLFGRALDVNAQKEEANTRAKADLVVNGETLATAVPATALLHLEGKLKQYKEVLLSIPTNDPAESWERDSTRPNTYVAKVRKVNRTVLRTKPVVLYEATKEHPAQVKESAEQVKVGEFENHKWSGMLTPKEKSDLLERCDELILAVKSARTRANEVVVDNNAKFSSAIFRFLNG